MHLKTAFALAALTASTAASAMPVSTFMTKADGLRAKGPFALLSGDLKLLTNQIKADSLALRADNQAAERAGKGKAYCTPTAGVSLSEKDVLAAMQAVPAPQRTSTSTKDALRAFLARRYPCPR